MKRTAIHLTLGLLLLLVGAEALLQAASAYTHWKYQREATILQPSTIRILCVGDSNVYGLYLPKEESWPSQLQVLLDNQYPGHYQVINFGFPGTQTFRIIESLPDMLATTQPDYVIFLAGANDLMLGTITLKPTYSWQESLRKFWLEHIRLWRFIRLAQINKTPAVTNAFDNIFIALSQLNSLDESASKKALADAYDPFVRATAGLSITLRGDRFSMDYKDFSIDLNPVLADLKKNSTDIYAMHQIYHSQLLKLHHETDINMASYTKMNFGGQTFILDPIINIRTDRDQKNSIQNNILLAQSITREHHARFVLLGYASTKNFYYATSNKIFHELVKKSTLEFIDTAPAIKAKCRNEDCPDYFFPDQHPTAQSYRIMAERIADYVLSQHANARP